MNRGTTFPEEDKLLSRLTEKKTKKVKRGRPRKGGFTGHRINFTKAEAEAAVRPTVPGINQSAIFQIGGFREYGPSKAYSPGHNRKGGHKGPDVSGAFIQYVGDSYDLARLEESISLDDGRARPEGYGPDR